VFEDGWHLYIADAADDSLVPLATGLEESFEPSWSPDGQRILFSGTAQHGGGRLIYLINRDGAGRRLVDSPSDLPELGGPSWSPNGTEVSYIARSSGGTSEALAMNLATGVRRSLTSGIPGFAAWTTEWSPDGGTMLFLDVSGSGFAISRLDFGTGAYQVIILGGSNRPGEWSPDGQWIVYGVGALRIADRNGQNGRLLLSDTRTNFEVTWAKPKPAP
jgi:TolB protein